MCAFSLGDLRGELKELSRDKVVVVERGEKSLERFLLTVMVKWDGEWEIRVYRRYAWD